MTTPPDNQQVCSLLQSMPVFAQLDHPELEELANLFGLVEVSRGQRIYNEDRPGTYFYIIYSGKVHLTMQAGGEDGIAALLMPGDYFGEEVFFHPNQREYTATALTNCLLLRLIRTAEPQVSALAPGFKKSVSIMNKTRKLNRKLVLPWLNPGEVIFYISRRHPFFLWKRLILPIFFLCVSLIAGIALLAQGVLPPALAGAIGMVILIFFTLWIAWSGLDWSNDYFIITDQRIVWMERVAGIYDSRQEAPLSTILSVDVNRSFWGQVIGYGDVVVKTYTVPLILQNQRHPTQVAALVDEQWIRSKQTNRRNESAAVEAAVRRQLIGEVDAVQADTDTTNVFHENYRSGFIQTFFANLFKVRYEEDGIVTYRKHWYRLIAKIWQPVAGLILGMIVWMLRLYDVFTFLPTGTVFFVIVSFWIACIFWGGYEFVDWRNDVYQVTGDQIIDIYRKPMGREEKKSAPLENILSIEYRRRGIISLILNYGSVVISVGTEKFTFDDVYNPSDVQQDIFRRMKEREQKKKLTQIKDERTRMSEWLAAYHKYSSDLPRVTPDKEEP